MSREVPQCKQSGIALQLATSMMAQPKMARMQGSSLPGSEMTTSLLLPTSVGAKGVDSQVYMNAANHYSLEV
jgi:hypothetical protein